MRRQLCLIATLLFFAVDVAAQKADSVPELRTERVPVLRASQTVTLSPSYSCRTKEEFQKGYEGTALFLSDFVRRDNSPDLLFNGACRSEDYFVSAAHGGNVSLVADLGADGSSGAPLLFDSFDKYDEMSRRALREMGFSESAPVKMGHTYVVLIDKTRVRGVFIFTVINYEANKRVELSYEVKDYQIRAAGFDRIK